MINLDFYVCINKFVILGVFDRNDKLIADFTLLCPLANTFSSSYLLAVSMKCPCRFNYQKYSKSIEI